MDAVRLTPTRVHRFYRGGALPQSCAASRPRTGSSRRSGSDPSLPRTTRAARTPRKACRDSPTDALLRDAVADDPIAWLGEEHVARFGTSTGVLVKLLDAGERLPVHAHPDRAFARRAFDSPFGKTEAWLSCCTRQEEADVWVGLREEVRARSLPRVDPGTGRRANARLAEPRLRSRRGCRRTFRAGVPHALGAGLLIAEVQEPTDFSLLCEWRDFPIEPEDSHLGLGWDEAAGALDLGAHSPIRSLPPESRSIPSRSTSGSEASGRFAVLTSSSRDTARSTASPPGRALRSRYLPRPTGCTSRGAPACSASSRPTPRV